MGGADCVELAKRFGTPLYLFDEAYIRKMMRVYRDTLAEKYADLHRISKHIIRPQYHLYNRAAPIKRNLEMVLLADKVLVIWDGVSRGTLSTINFAKEHNKPIMVINIKRTEK